jgi:Ribbon-helix-helix protein, copG family
MNTLTIKLPTALDAQLQLACQQRQLSKSELVRCAIAAYLAQGEGQAQPTSALQLAGDLVGCFEGGPPDLASNPEHLANFGRV